MNYKEDYDSGEFDSTDNDNNDDDDDDGDEDFVIAKTKRDLSEGHEREQGNHRCTKKKSKRIDDEDKTLPIESLLGRRRSHDGTEMEYFIKWKSAYRHCEWMRLSKIMENINFFRKVHTALDKKAEAAEEGVRYDDENYILNPST